MTRLPATVDDLRGLRAARWIRESTAGQYDRYGPEVQGGQIAAAIRRLGLVDTGLAWSPAHSGSTVHGSPAMRAMLEAAGAGGVRRPGRGDAATAGSATCARRSTSSRTTSTPSASWSGSTTSSCCRAASGTGTSWSTRRRAPSRGCASTGAASARATPPSAPRRATRAAGLPSGSGATPRRSSSSPTRTACPWSCAPSSSRPTAGPTARSPRRRACRCSPSGGCSPARSTSAGCGRASGRTGPPVVPPPLWEAVQAVRATRRTRDGRPAVVRRPYALTMLHCAGCGRHLIGDTGRYRHPDPCEAFTAVRREPRKRSRGQRSGCPATPTGCDRVRGDRPRRPRRRVAGRRPDRRGRRGHAGAGARPPGARPHRPGAGRRPGALPARPGPARPRGDDGRARRTGSRGPRPPAGARALRRRGRGLPAGPAAPVGRSAGLEARARRVAVRAGGGPGAADGCTWSRRRPRSPRASWRRSRAHLLVMVGARGFEPPTSSSRTMRATKLRHAPTEVLVVQSPGIVARAGQDRHAASGRPADGEVRAHRRRRAHVRFAAQRSATFSTRVGTRGRRPPGPRRCRDAPPGHVP